MKARLKKEERGTKKGQKKGATGSTIPEPMAPSRLHFLPLPPHLTRRLSYVRWLPHSYLRIAASQWRKPPAHIQPTKRPQHLVLPFDNLLGSFSLHSKTLRILQSKLPTFNSRCCPNWWGLALAEASRPSLYLAARTTCIMQHDNQGSARRKMPENRPIYATYPRLKGSNCGKSRREIAQYQPNQAISALGGNAIGWQGWTAGRWPTRFRPGCDCREPPALCGKRPLRGHGTAVQTSSRARA